MRIRPAASPSCRQHGLSLVELMVGLAIGLLILAGTLSVFLGSRENACLNDSLARVQENARIAFAAIGDEVYKAGYRSDPSQARMSSGSLAIDGDGSLEITYRRSPNDPLLEWLDNDGIIADCLGRELDRDQAVTTTLDVSNGQLRCTSSLGGDPLVIVEGVGDLAFTLENGNRDADVALTLNSGAGDCAVSQQFTFYFSPSRRNP